MKNSVLKTAVLGCAAGLSLLAFGGEQLIRDGDTVAMMGDSITQYGTENSAGYVQLFLRAIRTTGVNDFSFVGAGVAGNTSNAMRKRFLTDVIDKRPTVVTISSGVNDVAYEFPAQYAVYRDNIDFMATEARKAGAKVVLMTPTGTGGEGTNVLVATMAQIMRDYAVSNGFILADSYASYRAAVEDPAAPFMSKEGWKATVDGLHMGPVGNRAMARSLVAVMGLTDAEKAAVEADWNTAPICGIDGNPGLSLATYDLMEGYADEKKLEVQSAASKAFAAGLPLFLSNPSLPAAPSMSVPAGVASDCDGGDIATCGDFNWTVAVEYDPSGLPRLLERAFAANGSDRRVITGRQDGVDLAAIAAKFDSIVAPAKGSDRTVSHLIVAPGSSGDLTTDAQAASNVVAQARTKNVTVVFLTLRPGKSGEPALNAVLRGLADGSSVRTVDAYRIMADELRRRSSNWNAAISVHGNGRLTPRIDYLIGLATLPHVGFNSAAAGRAQSRWQSLPDFGGIPVPAKFGFATLDQVRALAKGLNVTVEDVYSECVRLGALVLTGEPVPQPKPDGATVSLK